jgi:protein gp37
MGASSAIEWTEATWNPVTGCTKISPGCAHCYAERMALRLQAMGVRAYERGFEPAVHEELLPLPFSWRRPRRVFVNSMSDLFHEEVAEEFIGRALAVMRDADWHQYQVLTKRAERLAALGQYVQWPRNVWMGVTVESADYAWRIDCLRQTQAAVKFVSFEPLLAPIGDVDLDGLDWVIVGGESGPGARPMDEDWATGLRDQCLAAGIPFFFKQWGGRNKKATGRELEGRTWDEMPESPDRLPALAGE